MNRIPESIWYHTVMILLLVAFGIDIAFEIAILRRVPTVLGRIAPFLIFWFNIILSFALRPDELVPIWIVPALNLGVLLTAIAVYIIAIPILRSFACKGEK